MAEKSARRTRNPAILGLTTSWVCFSEIVQLSLKKQTFMFSNRSEYYCAAIVSCTVLQKLLITNSCIR